MNAHFPYSRLVMLLVLGFCLPCASAATFYSDPVAGKAGGDGSAKSPWPKFEEVANSGKLAQLQGDDTLLLRSGDHGDVKISGDNAKFITIAAEPGQSPRLSRFY